MMRAIKIYEKKGEKVSGAVYHFDNDIVKVNKIDSGWEIQFLDNKPKRILINKNDTEYLNYVIDGLKKAYELVPVGAKIIPNELLPLCEGLLIGSILEDSLYPVYGVADRNGIKGCLCSIHWFLTEEEIKKFTDYESLKGGDLRIKQEKARESKTEAKREFNVEKN